MNEWLTLATILITTGAAGTAITAFTWLFIPRIRSRSSSKSKIRITSGDSVLEVTGQSKQDLQRVIDAWIALQDSSNKPSIQSGASESESDPSRLTENE